MGRMGICIFAFYNELVPDFCSKECIYINIDLFDRESEKCISELSDKQEMMRKFDDGSCKICEKAVKGG